MGKSHLTILLSLSVIYYCLAQNKEFNTTYFDSLLLKGNFDEFVSSWENFSRDVKIQKFSIEEIVEYDKLLNNLKQLNSDDQEQARELSTVFKVSYLTDVTHLRGEKADTLYKKYLRETENNNWKKSLEFYYTADYFASQHVRLEKLHLLNYNAAKDLFNQGKYDNVLSLIEEYVNEDLPNSAISSLNDSLAFLFRQLEVNTREALTLLEISASQSHVLRRFLISLGFGFASYQRTDEQAINLNHRTYSDLDLAANPFKEFLMLYNLQIEYCLTPDFSFGISAGIEPVIKTGLISPDGVITIKQQSFSLGILCAYYFRSNLGLRPFIKLKGGITGVSRDKVELNPASFWYEEYDFIDGVNKTYPEITAEIGTEYQFNPNDLFRYDFCIYYSSQLGDSNIIPKHYFGAIISCGINL